MYELNPIIWSKLPYDILHNIVEHSDLSTQINWSCTSRAIFPVASSNIWHSLYIFSSEITAYVHIVFGQRSRNHADGIVHFLLERAHRKYHTSHHLYTGDLTHGAFVHGANEVEKYSQAKQIYATLPISRVKDLEIDNQGFHAQHPICNKADMDHVLPVLIKCLPNLQSFKYIGPLSASSLAAIIQVGGLRVLEARNGNDVLQAPTRPSPTFIMPWLDPSLDLSVLANLQGLQTLEVGRLTRHEACGLAKGVASLKLRNFHLSCWGWEYENSIPSRSMHSKAYTSPLVLFLEALTTPGLSIPPTCRGLPSALKALALIDRYYSLIPSLHQLIATAILPCENLESLSTTISVTGKCYDIISKMGLPAYHKIVRISSWQQLSCDEEIKVLHQYQSPSGEKLHTDAYPKPLRNIVKTLDRVIATAKTFGAYRMSMRFVRERQFRTNAILIYACEEEHRPSAAERGPQAEDADMMDLAADFRSLSLDERS